MGALGVQGDPIRERAHTEANLAAHRLVPGSQLVASVTPLALAVRPGGESA